jgi:hypothetical protein
MWSFFLIRNLGRKQPVNTVSFAQLAPIPPAPKPGSPHPAPEASRALREEWLEQPRARGRG